VKLICGLHWDCQGLDESLKNFMWPFLVRDKDLDFVLNKSDRSARKAKEQGGLREVFHLSAFDQRHEHLPRYLRHVVTT
jgi:hypothetical protein